MPLRLFHLPRVRRKYIRYLESLLVRALDDISLLVERRWVDKSLPERELLDALAHCYGVLSLLLADAHDRAAVEYFTTRATARGDIKMDRVSEHRGRLPCMVTTLDARTAHYRTTDGSLVRGERFIRALSQQPSQKLLRRYGFQQMVKDVQAAEASSALDYVDPLFEQAKRVLSRDKFHSMIVVLYRGGQALEAHQGILRDRAGKYAFSQNLVERVAINDADGIVMLGEVWQSRVTFDEGGVPIPPAEAPDPREALEVYAETKDGSFRARHAFFRERLGRIVFDEEIDTTVSLENNFLAPIRALWAGRSESPPPDNENTHE